MSTSRQTLAVLLLLAWGITGPAHSEDRLFIEPDQWSFDVIPDNETIHQEVTVRNMSAASVRVSFVPTCDCLFVQPAQAELPPRSERVFLLTFDPAGYDGPIDMDYIVRTSLPGSEKALFRLLGQVRSTAANGGHRLEETEEVSEGSVLTLSYYFSPGCGNCERFLSREIPRLEEQLGISLKIERNDIFDAEYYERYLDLLQDLGEQERAYPAIVAGDRVLQGDKEIEAKLHEVLAELAGTARLQATGQGRAPPEDSSGRGRVLADLAVIPVAAAGLLDGINPCAFTTLIFLMSALAVAGRRRREVLILGLFYTASVFMTYYLIGLGFLGAIRYAQSFFLVATIIRWTLVTVLATFAALSFYDFLLIRGGNTSKIVLQLPGTMKRRIHETIKSRSRSAALVGSAMVLGFLVSVFELACTGQVYLPTIVYTVRSGQALRGYMYLLIYNLGFVVPLLVVFALSFAGLSLKSLTAIFQKRMGSVKLALAALFAALAVLTILM